LEKSDGTVKSILLNGSSIDIARALGGNASEMEISQILNERSAYGVVEQEATAKQEEPQRTKKDELDRSTSRTSRSIGGALIAAPFGIYAHFFNNPDRYTAKQLDKTANWYGEKEAKKAQQAAKKSRKTFSEEDGAAAFERGRIAYHDQYVLYHDKRARQLANDPATNNPLLKRSLFYKDTKAAMARAAEEARKDKSAKITSVKSLPQDVRRQIPTTSPIKSVAMGTSSKLTPIRPSGIPTNYATKPGVPNAPKSLKHAPPGVHPSRGIRNPLSKILPKNPLSLLRFLLPGSIIGVLAAVVFLTIIITFFFGVGDVAGGSSSSSGGTGDIGTGGGTGSGGTDIISWAKIIDDKVTFFTGPKCLNSPQRTVMMATVTNGSYTVLPRSGSCGKGLSTFFCTDLVIGSYNLAGIKNSFSRRSPVMAAHWTGGVQLMTSQSVIEQAQPGDVMFYSCNNTMSTIGHVDIIYSIDQDQLARNKGTGRIITIDANTPTEIITHTLRNWKIGLHFNLDECAPAEYMWLGKSNE
jgi:hypothetical protein